MEKLAVNGSKFYVVGCMMFQNKNRQGENMKINLHKQMLFCFLALSFLLTACGTGPASATSTSPAVPTDTSMPPTSTYTPTVTPVPTSTPQPTATPNLAATQQYEDFLALVQKVYDAGQISTLDGEYMKLDDFSDELAMNYGYNRTPTGVNAKDFIIRADFDWEVANQKNYSGCGYRFRQDKTDPYQYYYITALDGINGVLMMYTVTFEHKPASLVKKMKMPDLGSNPYHAQFTLVVSDTSAYTYVNGIFYNEYKLQNNWVAESGPLEYMVLTGSDKDYGTRCKITNAEVWVIQP